MNRPLGYAAFFLTAIIYGSFGILIRILQGSFSPLQQIFIRSLGAVAISCIFALLLLPKGELRHIKNPKVLFFGLLFPCSIFCWTLAVTLGPINLAVFGLYFGSILFAPIFSRLLFHEVLTGRDTLVLFLAMVGVGVFCFKPGHDFSLEALGLSTFAGIFQALSLCYRRWLGSVSRLSVMLVQSIGGLGIATLLLLSTSQEMFPLVGVAPYGYALCYSALVVLVSYLLLIGSNNLESTRGNIILSAELFWAMVFAYIFLAEVPTKFEMIGSLILIFAMTLNIQKSKVDLSNELEK